MSSLPREIEPVTRKRSRAGGRRKDAQANLTDAPLRDSCDYLPPRQGVRSDLPLGTFRTAMSFLGAKRTSGTGPAMSVIGVHRTSPTGGQTGAFDQSGLSTF